MALVATLVYPLLAPHFAIARKESETIEKMALDRIAEDSLVEVMEGLHERQLCGCSLSWGQLEAGVKGHFVEQAGQPYRIKRYFEIKLKPEASVQLSYRLLQIDLEFTRLNNQPAHRYSYAVILKT